MLPYLFPELSTFATVADLITHLRTSDARLRAALPTEFCAKNPPPLYWTLHFIVTRLPDTLSSVRDYFLARCPTELTVALLEEKLLAAEKSIVAVGAARGAPRTPIFGVFFSLAPLAPSYATTLLLLLTSLVLSLLALLLLLVGGAALARARGARVAGVALGGEGVGEVGGEAVLEGAVAGVPVGVGPAAEAGAAAGAVAVVAAAAVAAFAVVGGGRWAVVAVGGGRCSYVIRTGDRKGQTCGRFHTPYRCFFRLDDAWREEMGEDVERPRWAELMRAGVDIFALDYDAIIAAMYALTVSAEGDCYLCVPPDPGIEPAALGTSESALSGMVPPVPAPSCTVPAACESALSGTAPTETALSVSLADPSGGPVLARSTTVLPCPAVPSGSLTGFHLPSFSTNLVSNAVLQDQWVDTFTPGGQVCGDLHVLQDRPSPGYTLLWHHRLGHPSLPRLRGMHRRHLVSGLPRSLPPLPASPAPPCLPCVEGRQRAAPHSSSFPPTEAPLQTLHLDVWGPARVRGQGGERYFLLVVDDYSRYTTVFPLRTKGEVPAVLIPWIRTVRLQLRRRFRTDLPVLRLHSDRGGEFFPDLLRTFCQAEGIEQTFTLPDSPQQNGVAERRIGLVMEVARTSLVHAAAPHFLWPFAVRYAAHQLNLWPAPVSLPETSPTLRWTGEVGDASRFRVWGARALVRDTSADKLSSRTLPCVFLGFVDPPPVAEPVEVTGDSGAAAGGAESGGAEPEGAGPGGAGTAGAGAEGTVPESSAPGGAEPGGAATGGAEPACAESGGAESGGAAPAGTEPGGAATEPTEPRVAASGGAPVRGAEQSLTPQQLRDWYVRRFRRPRGSAGAGGAGAAGTGCSGSTTTGAAGAGDSGAGGASGVVAADPGGGAAAGAADPPGGAAAGAEDPGGGAAAGAGDPDAGVSSASGAAARPRPYFVPLLQQVLGQAPPPCPPPSVECPPTVQPQSQLPPASPLPAALLLTLVPQEVLQSVSDRYRAEHPTVTRLLATVVTDPTFESSAVSALVAELVDFAAACRLDYAASLVAESGSVCPPSVGGECALGTDLRMLDIPREMHGQTQQVTASEAYWQTAMDMRWHPGILKSTGTYVDEVPPPGANIVDGMWIFRVKRPPGSPPVFKARYVARGFTCTRRSGYAPPPGFTGSFPPGTQWSLRRPVYGLRQAPREWHDTLRTTLAALGFAPSTADPSLFLRTDTSLPPFYILVYVDDLLLLLLTLRHSLITRDRARRTITLTQSHMVQQVTHGAAGPSTLRLPVLLTTGHTRLATSHSLSAPPPDESVEPSGPYPELVGCLMYLMTCTRPDLAYPLSILARYVAPGRHRREHWEAAKRVLRYLCSTSGMGLVLGGHDRVVLTGHSDASWVDDLATQRSSQGYTFSLGSGSVSWRSTRSSSVLSSSCEAEIYATAMAAQELRWLTYLLTDLGERPSSPPVLYGDNKAALALCQEHRLEHRTKHIALRYFLARELQQRGQLRLVYVDSKANTADIFTKALPPSDHQRHCTSLGLVSTFPHLLTA
ncbi:unnamed protein product [Closterium sp. Yama58-4]|nr:unnamed protein product [Closterium sp. Yama58-4]